jgi:hypothetical protein
MQSLRIFLGISLLLAGVSVQVAAAPSLEFVSITNERLVSLRMNGTDGRDYMLEMSTNLTTWSNLLQLRMTNQAATVQYLAPAGLAAVFFRAREVAVFSNLTVVPLAATNFTATTLVRVEGGSAQLVTPSGTRIVLNINPGVVPDAETISMTLLTNVSGLPFASGTFGAVRIEPEQARFSGSLEIFYPQGLDRRRVASFRADHTGANFRLTFDRASSNRVVIPILQSGIYGSSVATLAELSAAAAFAPIFEAPPGAQGTKVDSDEEDGVMLALQRPQACWGDSFASEQFLQSTKDCFDERIVQALVVRCQIEQALEEAQRPLIRDMQEDRQRQLLGELEDDTQTALQRAITRICPFYRDHVAPQWARAQDDCAMTMMLLKFVFSFQSQLEDLGLIGLNCVPNLQDAGRMACAGVTPCLQEIQECCERGLRGRGRFAEILALYRQFVLFGTADCFDPYGPETKPAREACYTNAWMGSFSISEKWSSTTNIVGPGRASFTSTNSYEYYFEGTVDLSEEQRIGGTTNISLNVTGTAAAQFYSRDETKQGIDCRDPDPDVESIQRNVSESLCRTTANYFLGISIGATGEYTVVASTFTMLDSTQRDHKYVLSAFCDGRVEVENVVTTKPQPYLGSSLLTPVTRMMTGPDRISGSADIVIPSDDGPHTMRVEWILARNQDVPQGP